MYEQTSFRPDRGTGERKWRYTTTLGRVTADARGEALFQLPFNIKGVTHSFLLATEPLQQNELYSGYNIVDNR